MFALIVRLCLATGPDSEICAERRFEPATTLYACNAGMAEVVEQSAAMGVIVRRARCVEILRSASR